jgi:hypothetical protein
MKKISFLLNLCFLILTLTIKAQTPPNAFNYSAVARNPAGQPIATTTIGIQITILKTSPTGESQYSENHFVDTDAFGLFNLVIGAGAVESGSMAAIEWSNDNYYLKVGMDATGGTNFLTMGTTQLLSVPYALHAKTAESITGGGAGGGFTHYIGEEFGGGVIFHLWKDSQGNEHGLIVDKTDLSSSQVWSNVDQALVGENAQSSFDGLSNSNAIVNQIGHTSSAAALCLNSTNGGQNDWYLPSIDELFHLSNNRLTINKILPNIGGETIAFDRVYWSSTEYYDDFDIVVLGIDFSGDLNVYSKASSFIHIRAIRAF